LVVPVVQDIIDVGNASAFLPDLVHREVCPKVRILCHILESRNPNVGDFQNGARLRVALTEN
jgi:hypothetical protein